MTGIDRRRFLRGAALTAGALASGGTLGSLTTARAADATKTAPNTVQFHGTHQAGILQHRQPAVAYLALDSTAASKTELADVFRTLTERARLLTAGGQADNLGISAPPVDNGILGPDMAAAGLTVTVGVGASLFDGRYGLTARKPARLRAMDTFPDDDLDRAQCDGDVLIQLAAEHPDAVVHAMLDLLKQTRGGLQLRWRLDGTTPPPRPDGAPRNYLGFKDGIANPDVNDAKQMDSLVWVPPGGAEPGWTAGGSYHVVRAIRMLLEFWNRVNLSEQEQIIGRRRDTGAPLSAAAESDAPDYSNDPIGAGIPLNAHIRLANPRTAATDNTRILRRGYNYDRGIDSNGNLDAGLIFTCFQQDLDRQFVAVQKRLNGEPLADYISAVGGGYFFALPGVRDAQDWYGSGLFG